MREPSYNAKWLRKKRVEWKAKGLCHNCGGERDSPTRNRCEICRSAARRYYRRAVEEAKLAGQCLRCGAKKDREDRTHCKDCREDQCLRVRSKEAVKRYAAA